MKVKERAVAVTISGADDAVKPSELVELSAEFPFVEWGILFSTKRHGTKRYPTIEWIGDVRAIAKSARNFHFNLSLHLCGDVARRVLSGKPLPEDVDGFQRIQINGYEPPLSPEARENFRDVTLRSRLTTRIILQAKRPEVLALAIDDVHPFYGAVLIDGSGGEGKPIDLEQWDITSNLHNDPRRLLDFANLGFAGGLGPDSCPPFLEKLATARTSDGGFWNPCWIDMESGVRDEHDEFDRDKVRKVLVEVKRFREGR